MTAVADQIPLDVLDDAEHQTPAWMSYRQQMGAAGDPGVNVIPRGTYTSTLIDVTVVRRKDGGGFALRMIARTVGLGRFVLAWRGLSSDPSDPFALTEGELRGLRKFAATMGISTKPAPPQAIVQGLYALQGEQIDAKVVQTPAGPQATFSRPIAELLVPSTSPVVMVDGRVVDGDGEAHELQGAAATAHEAHERLLSGLRRAHEGLAIAAEGCYRLQKSEGWVALGYETLSEYLATPEITVSRSEFFRLADIWESYVLDGGVDPRLLGSAGPSKLEVPLPALKQGVVSAEQAAADAEAMTRNDLREHYKDLLGDQPAAPRIVVEDESPSLSESPAGGSADQGDAAEAERLQQALENADAELVRLRSAREEAEQRAEAWKADSMTHVESLKAHREMIEQLNADLAQVQSQLQRDTAHALLPEDQADLIGAAKGAVRTLRQVLDEIGDPKQKRMGKDLRQRVVAALQEADDQGLGE